MMTDTTAEPHQSGLGKRRLERPRDGRVFAGVAIALARRYDIGPGWVRAAFLFASLFGGIGLLAYLVGWLAIPEEGQRDSVAARYIGRLDRASSWVGALLIVLAVLIVLGATDLIDGQLLWAGALVTVGVLLYRGDLDASPHDAPPPPGPAPSEDASGDEPEPTVEMEADGGGHEPPPSLALEAPVAPQPAPPRRPPSILGRVTVAATLIAVGLVALADQVDVLSPRPIHYAIVVVGGAGLGLLAGAFVGRARGLIALGLVALPFLLFLSWVDVPWGAGWGTRTVNPTVVTAIPAQYEHAGGELDIDLRSLDLNSFDSVEVNARLGFGQLTVIVPRDVGIELDAKVSAGQIDVFGSQSEGMSVDRSVSIDGDPTIVLDLKVTFGEVQVSRGRN